MKAFEPRKCKIALLAGGRSSEREVSLASGDGAQRALVTAGFTVERIDPARREDLIRLIDGDFDVAFLALHGRYGEDGAIQGFLELIGLPYTGSGIWSSSTSIDKAKTKAVYRAHGIPTPRSVMLVDGDGVAATHVMRSVGADCVIKSACEGSALGVFVCHGPEDIARALDEVFTFGNKAIAETFIAGDEFTCAVIGNENPRALPLIQIIPQGRFYDFDSKYAPGGARHLCPAPVSDAVAEKAMRTALAAHKALECRGVSRTDFILDADGCFWALETNSLPGMTETSLLPDAAQAAGISFPELCALLVEYVLETGAR